MYLTRLVKALVKLATSTKQVHTKIRQQWPRERYFRFNVQSGLAGIRLDRFRALDDIHAATSAYLDDPDVQYELDRCAKAVFTERWKEEPLQYSAKRLWHRESAVGEWYLERVDAADPYPFQHPRIVSPSEIKPIGSSVICAYRPLNGSLRFSDSGVPAGEYTVVWIMSFFGSLSRVAGGDSFDSVTVADPPAYTAEETDPDLFLIAGTPDKKFHETPLPPGPHGSTAEAADLKLFRGGTVKHTIRRENWDEAYGYGWVEVASPSETISVDQSGTVAFYISQPKQNYVASWCLGGVRLVPVTNPSAGGALSKLAVRQPPSPGGEGRPQEVMSRPASPVPAPRPNPRRARSASPQRPIMPSITAPPSGNAESRNRSSANRVVTETRLVDDFDDLPPTRQPRSRKAAIAEPRTIHRFPMHGRMALSREQSRRGRVMVTIRVAGDDSD